jgi:glycosyltransferase involved in cell wall biosynthesis
VKALLVHPVFSVFGGGEYVALNVIIALRDSGYDVSLMSQDYDPDAVRRAFHFEEALDEILVIAPTKFKPKVGRAMAFQRMMFARQERRKTAQAYRNFDIVFHTQPSRFLGPPVARTFNVFYDPSDRFLIRKISLGESHSKWKRPYYSFRNMIAGSKTPYISESTNIPLSSALEEQLESCGFKHTDYFFPPCDMSFKPRPKESRVIQVTRVVPHKRLEVFAEIARCLPDYEFIIVGSLSETEKKLHPGYAEKLVNGLPSNVRYVERRIRDCPDFLEESSVYLYTSIEPGINISTAQAVGAGCTPVTPDVGGGAEIVRTIGVGYTYDSIDRAVRCVKQALEHPSNPSELSKVARIFSAEFFQERIRKLVA